MHLGERVKPHVGLQPPLRVLDSNDLKIKLVFSRPAFKSLFFTQFFVLFVSIRDIFCWYANEVLLCCKYMYSAKIPTVLKTVEIGNNNIN